MSSNLQIGIVGLPNVGKSTLFNAITKAGAEAANFPFCTIEPNVGVVEVPDHRIYDLAGIFNPKKTTPAFTRFVDIAGLVAGASKGEGLGNQFLSHIRETDAIAHVVRCFDDSEIIHVDGNVDPKRDIETIELELIMSDLDVLAKRLDKIGKKAQMTKDKDALAERELIKLLTEELKNFKSARLVPLTEEQKKIVKEFNLLSMKPVIYVGNVSEESYQNPSEDKYFSQVMEIAKAENAIAIPVSAKIESDLAPLSSQERAEYLNMLGTNMSGLDKVAKASYDLLGLKTFFTVGSDEVRAWTFKDGMKAPECAGIIHTDFEKGFIKAEVYSYEDICEYKSEVALRQAGKIMTCGKEYVVRDGDCLFIKFNVTK